MFTINGQWQGEPASITWDDGAVTGNPPEAAEAFEKFAENLEWVTEPLMAVVSSANHLSKAFPTMILLYRFLRPVESSSGDVPKLPETPPDAVA